MTLGPLTFLYPWFLLLATALPGLWWLLRRLPPAPKRVRFGAVFFLLGLGSREDTPERTPLWILLVRMVLAALVIGALARPVLYPLPSLPGDGPLLIVLDDGWAAAPHWQQANAVLKEVVDQAAREGREIALLRTAGEKTKDGGQEPLRLRRAAEIRSRLTGLAPQPWPTDRAAAAARLAVADLPPGPSIWLSDGLADLPPGGGPEDDTQDGRTPVKAGVKTSLQESAASASGSEALLQIMRQRGGTLRLLTPAQRAPLLLPPAADPGESGKIHLTALGDRRGKGLTVAGYDLNGRLLGKAVLRQENAATSSIREDQSRAGMFEGVLDLPSPWRNRLSRLEIIGEAETDKSAGGVFLLDDVWRRPVVGIVATFDPGSTNPRTAAGGVLGGPNLLDPRHYVTQALLPHSDLRHGSLEALLAGDARMIVLTEAAVPPSLADQLGRWVAAGGVLVRFAGNGMLAAVDLPDGPFTKAPEDAHSPADPLLPVRLRRDGRILGGAMSWSTTARLAPFGETSPFAGLEVPGDILIKRQLLAEPDLLLSSRSWAQLDDGTPLVTGDRRGKGWVVLFHVTATPAWSDLPLSGLFVQMMQRLLALPRGPGSAAEARASFLPERRGGKAAPVLTPPLAPWRTLDGFGRLRPPAATIAALVPGDRWQPGADHPPGVYGRLTLEAGSTGSNRPGRLVAVNLGDHIKTLAPLTFASGRIASDIYGGARQRELRPLILAAAAILLLLDTVMALTLARTGDSVPLSRRRWRLPPWKTVHRGLGIDGRENQARKPRVALWGVAIAFLIPALAVGHGPGTVKIAAAQPPDDPAMEAALEMRLAHVASGVPAIDDLARRGLAGLTRALAVRTALELASPQKIDLENDEVLFYPLLYWPLPPEGAAAPLSPATAAKLNHYLRAGGMILFDTLGGPADDAVSSATGSGPLARLAGAVQIPPLSRLAAEHVLTRSFYLIDSFPGRWRGGDLWLDSGASTPDGVAAVIVGNHDWAAAWAEDDQGRPAVPLVPGGSKQREAALRFGINLVMYAVTGNYKQDQIHVPAILQRLEK